MSLIQSLFRFKNRFDNVFRFERIRLKTTQDQLNNGLLENVTAKTDHKGPLNLYRLNNYEKYLMVWTKRYKNKSAVPNFLSYVSTPAAISKVRSKAGIVAANCLIIGSIISCFLTIQQGKNERQKRIEAMEYSSHYDP